RLLFEIDHVAHDAREIDRLALWCARARELEELAEQALESFDLGLDDVHAALHRLARGGIAELVEVPAEQMELEHGGVQRISDLVREAERERRHRIQRLGVGRAAFERASLG